MFPPTVSRRRCDENCRQGSLYSFCAVGAIGLSLLIILVPLSVKNIAQDEWGLNYRQVLRVFSGGASGPGRVLWQPDSHLVTFKNTFVPWEDTVDCWTEDGLETNLTVAVQTRYIPEELFDIVFEFGEEDSFVPFVTEIVSELLRDECSKFTAFNYYDSRGIIQTNMTNRIETDLPRLSTHIRSGGFLQLKNIKLPDEFNVAITNKRIAEQDIQVRQNQRAQQIIVANTHFSQAINNGLIQINTAKQNAQALLFAAQQQALGIQAAYAQRVLVYTLGAQQLNLTADEYVNQILTVKLLESANHANVFV